MIKLNFFPKLGGTGFVDFHINDIKHGIDFLLFSLENINDTRNGLSLSINERGNAEFSTINFQQVGQKYLFQIFLSNEELSGHKEGWHCLIDKSVDKNLEDLLATVWEKPNWDYFQVRFSEGVLFSKELLVSKPSLRSLLLDYCEDWEQWYKSGQWKFLGLI